MTNQFLGLTETEREGLLDSLGFRTIDDLFSNVVPQSHQFLGKSSALGEAKSELEVRRLISSAVSKNQNIDPEGYFLGAGHYQREIPSAVLNVAGRGEWMTPYTPYQAEAAQGILATLFEYQNYVQIMSGMKIANAGLYHGTNALVEAALMACRITGREKVLYSESLSPIAIRNLQSAFDPKIRTQGFELAKIPSTNGLTSAESIESLLDDKTAAVIIQNPNFWGLLDGMENHQDAIHSKGALFVSYGGADQISLGMIEAPGNYGADIYAGEGQHFGVPIGYGGPHVGMLAMSDALDDDARRNVRQLPGRLVLPATDKNGKRGFRLGLQTREQHIRREKATSNTCTSETLIAVMSTLWFAIKGPHGIQDAANQSYQVAHHLSREISQIPGYSLLHNSEFFNEFAVRTPAPATQIVDYMATQGIFAGVPLARIFPYSFSDPNLLLVAATEMNNSVPHLNRLLEGLNASK